MRDLEVRFGASCRLAVYGSLAPGETHDDVLADVAGVWHRGRVRGRLLDRGWGSGKGYPGLIWDERGPPVDVRLLVSEHLADHWSRLDDFEGEEYLRILVPVRLEGGGLEVANLYALREAPF